MIRIDNPDVSAQAECFLNDVLAGKVKCFILSAVVDDEVVTIISGADEDEQYRLVGSLLASVVTGSVSAQVASKLMKTRGL